MLGGLLMALSIIGVFAAYREATATTTEQFVVAARDLVPGTRLALDDLTLAAIDLPPSLAARASTEPNVLVGDVTVAPLAAGDLIQASGVVDGADGEPAAELSFAVDRDRAVNGVLSPGERVDLIVTYGTGDTAWTELVVSGARVVAVDDGDDPLVLEHATVLTVALPHPTHVLPVTHAVRAGDITVVRTTLDPESTGGTYQPRPPDAPPD